MNLARMNHIVFVSVLFIQILAVCAQSRLCYRQLETHKINSRLLYRQASRSHSYSYGCGWLGWSRCRGVRYSTFRQSYQEYRMVVTYSAVSHCCSGYTGTPPNCQDVDECLTNNDGCTQICINIDGSYQCSCWDGYQLDGDDHTCIDVDECLTDNGGCTQTCNNIDGSYQCSCQDGFEMDNDNHTCIDIEECVIGIHNCSQLCVELHGGYKCDCSSGYELGDDGTTCEDIDECTTSNGGCQHVCKNNDGSHQCLCNDGYMPGEDEYSCEDIDECSDSNGGCQHNCINTNGTYNCSCAAGYSLDIDNQNCSFIESDKISKGDSSSTAGPIAGTIIAVFVLVIILLVLIIYVLVRYQKKHKPSSVFVPSATGVPNCNNAMTIAAAKKEKVLNEDTLNNPTYNPSKTNDCNTLSEYENTSPAVPQDYEVPYDNVQY